MNEKLKSLFSVYSSYLTGISIIFRKAMVKNYNYLYCKPTILLPYTTFLVSLIHNVANNSYSIE